MAKKNKLEHANRNKALAVKLLQESVYFDWVVTTSFYSSIHFIENHLFPTTIMDTTCDNLFDAQKKYNSANLHETRECLCQDKLTFDVALKYKWLSDNSKNARYTSYKISKAVAEKAIVNLNAVETACVKKN